MCERKCANFEFEYDGVIGLNSMKLKFKKMKEDVQRVLGNVSNQHGILIKEKLIGSDDKCEDRNILLVDRNGDGRLDHKGLFFSQTVMDLKYLHKLIPFPHFQLDMSFYRDEDNSLDYKENTNYGCQNRM